MKRMIMDGQPTYFKSGEIIKQKGEEVKILHPSARINSFGVMLVEYECEFVKTGKKFRQFEQTLVNRMKEEE
ncbi:MAG: hypothetical protein ACRCYA_02930 [Cetobacterium sp.]|uniref:hypothetical protein n=1 Tax=Cetobacterium sp. TaxID=2071632 RepID=UPI003F2B5CC5